jgi:LDH2 family malate/lactate/ureidoglycolate dehydrogenase
MDEWIKTMRSTRPQPGFDKVLIPGDPERRAFQKRQVEGIPLNIIVFESLQTISKETGITLNI